MTKMPLNVRLKIKNLGGMPLDPHSLVPSVYYNYFFPRDNPVTDTIIILLLFIEHNMTATRH